MTGRVLMIGLDGASPALVEKWQDDLPNLRRLLAGGAWGVLRSTVPHYTLPAWQSMVTGANPGKLGIFGFRHRLPGTTRSGFSTLASSPAATIWDVLGQEGCTSGVVGLPGTFPPRSLTGFMVSGFPAPANDGRLIFTYPETLSRELDERSGRYELQVYQTYRSGEEGAFVAACERVGRLHGETAVWLARTRPWDFLAVVFLTIDRASHYLWRYMDPTHPAHDPAEAARWGNALRDFYRLEDENIGRLLELVDEDDLILVTSDHGFGPHHRVFFINEWLRRMGYLRLKEPVARRNWRRLLAPVRIIGGRCMEPVVRLYQRRAWARSLLSPLRKTAARDRLMAAHHAYRHGRLRFENAPIDWNRTVAYALDQHRVYLNLEGREPAGAVPLEAYDETLSRLERDLARLTDDEGYPLSVILQRGRDLYNGPFVSQAPDLLVFPDNYRCNVNSSLGGGQLVVPASRISGTHHPDGLLILWGKGVRAGQHLGADIVDVAPTILHALGAPVPTECDGQPIWQAFEEDAAYRRRPLRIRPFTARTRQEHAWSEEDEAQIMERLRDLGYV